MTGSRRRLTRTSVALAAALVLSSCADGKEAGETPSPTVSPSPSSTVNVPEDMELTELGADLTFGESATVIYEPNQKRGTVLELTVKNATMGKLKDFSGFILDEYTRTSRPYYVNVKVRNVGEGQIGGTAVPLWGVDANNTLLPPATFTTTFRSCPSKPLPSKFGPDAAVTTCLVFLAPNKGRMRAVSFRPNQEFDPIEWTGDIITPSPKPEPAPKRKTKRRR